MMNTPLPPSPSPNLPQTILHTTSPLCHSAACGKCIQAIRPPMVCVTPRATTFWCMEIYQILLIGT